MNRRALLKGALGGLAGLSLAPHVRAADAPGVTPIAGKLNLITGAGGNVLVRATDAGQVLVDSGAADLTGALLAALGKLPGAGRVQRLFNTHWHLDQIGGNEKLGESGTPIVAHEKTRLHLAVGYYLPAEERYHPPAPAKAQPTESFYTTGETVIDGERVEYGYLLEAHTDGDIYVYFRDSNVIAVGDALSPLRDPELDWFGGGWLGGRLDSQDLLLKLGNAQTRFVPSYGPAVGRAELQKERDLMQKLFDVFFERVRKGESADDMLAAGVMNGLGRAFDDPRKFVQDTHKGFWAHYNTLSPDIV